MPPEVGAVPTLLSRLEFALCDQDMVLIREERIRPWNAGGGKEPEVQILYPGKGDPGKILFDPVCCNEGLARQDVASLLGFATRSVVTVV